MDHDGSTFQCGCAPFYDLIFFAKEIDELGEEGEENSSFFMMDGDDWSQYDFSGAWIAIYMATIKPLGLNRIVVAVSPGGAYFEVEPQSGREIYGGIPEVKSSLRSLTVVDDMIYACGMGRALLRRNNSGVWEEIGPGTSVQDDGLVVGFEDLAGFSVNEMYAVGWGGEVWRNSNGTWQQLDSPVSSNLNAVCCSPNGNVYIVGDDGIMLKGRNDVWEVLEVDRTDNLMDVAFYGNTVYVSTDFEILKLEGAGLISEDEFTNEDDLPMTCLHLLPAEDGLISMGTKDLFRLHNGVWERLA